MNPGCHPKLRPWPHSPTIIPIQSSSRPPRLQRPCFSFSSCTCCRLDNHYRTLGLNQSATARQIKANFYELSRTHHPDMNPSGASSAEQFKKISEAYSVLSDPEQRKRYDQTLIPSGMNGGSDMGTTYAGMAGNYGTRNAERRANANYAWSTRGTRTGLRGDPRGRRDPLKSAQKAGDFSASLDRFERLARRRKPASASSSPLSAHSDPWSSLNHSTASNHPRKKVSPAQQAAQMALMLSLIFWIGSKLSF